jgi:FkbM family methyltransferase
LDQSYPRFWAGARRQNSSNTFRFPQRRYLAVYVSNAFLEIPFPKPDRLLAGNVALNGLRNVTCHHAAVTSEGGGIIEFYVPEYSHASNIGGVELKTPARSDNHGMNKPNLERAQTLVIDDLGLQVDFMKMDIEGMEDSALRGAEKTVSTCRPACFVELFKTDMEFVQAFFRGKNYVGFVNPQWDLITFPAEHELNLADMRRVF